MKRLLRESRGKRNGLVVVFGSGLNIQACTIEGCGPDDDWAGLLDSIGADIGLSPARRRALPPSFLARWERLVSEWCRAQRCHPYEAESQLQLRVVKGLRELEQASARFSLYREFARSRLADLISLNFDRRIALALGSEEFDEGPPKPPEGPSAAPLYRHSRIVLDGKRPTRVWYPHGDTKRADTLKLGVRRYGFHLGLMCEHLGMQNSSWRVFVPWEARDSDDAVLDDNEVAVSWIEVFMRRPLLFLGAGLGPDEWSLWWLLRTRNDSPNAPPAYYAHVGSWQGSLAGIGASVGLRSVSFPSYRELWATIREGIA